MCVCVCVCVCIVIRPLSFDGWVARSQMFKYKKRLTLK